MITHYGLFWSERDVFWGRRNNPGRLLGKKKTPLGRRGAPTRKERQTAEDYRNYIGIYCLYNRGKLIYVGEAGVNTRRTLFDRLKDHRKPPLGDRWDSFSWFGRDNSDGKCNVKKALSQVEAIVIGSVNPGFNKKSGSFAGAELVYQVPDEDAEGSLDTKITTVLDIIRNSRWASPPQLT